MRSCLRLTFNLIVFPSLTLTRSKIIIRINVHFFFSFARFGCQVSSQISLYGTHEIQNSLSWILIYIPESCSMITSNGFLLLRFFRKSHMLWNRIRRQNNDVKDISQIQNCSKKNRTHLFKYRKYLFKNVFSTNLNDELFRIVSMAHGKSSEKQFNASKVFRWIKEHFTSNLNLKSNSIRLTVVIHIKRFQNRVSDYNLKRHQHQQQQQARQRRQWINDIVQSATDEQKLLYNSLNVRFYKQFTQKHAPRKRNKLNWVESNFSTEIVYCIRYTNQTIWVLCCQLGI